MIVEYKNRLKKKVEQIRKARKVKWALAYLFHANYVLTKYLMNCNVNI